MSEVQYSYVPDQQQASPTAPWIDELATASIMYQPRIQDPHLAIAAYLKHMQSC